MLPHKRLPLQKTQGVHPDQLELIARLKAVKKAMTATQVCFNGRDMTLWDFAGLAIETDVVGNLLIDEKVKRGKLVSLLEVLTDCEIYIYKIFEERTWQSTLYRMWSMKMFGSLEQLRTELELRYPKTELVFLKTADHKVIHGYWIPYNQAEDAESDPIAPTMIMCGPNAEQAEMIQFNPDLLEFYLKNGINLMVFNYRGYGLSEGTPSISKIRKDAETVAQYVRQKIGPNAKLGAHGRSIGGVVATHLARKGLVDFLFADRTFSSLDEVAAQMLGSWARHGLQFFTLWLETEIANDYVFSNCYKVLSVAHNDEVIKEAASLKTGVAKVIVSA